MGRRLAGSLRGRTAEEQVKRQMAKVKCQIDDKKPPPFFTFAFCHLTFAI
jgi:hypothetical protein